MKPRGTTLRTIEALIRLFSLEPCVFLHPLLQDWRISFIQGIRMPHVRPSRVLIADDHEIVRRGLRSLIESDPHWEVCGEASDGRDAVAMAERLAPDVTIIDVTMPGLNGIEATRQIKRLLPQSEVLIFSGSDSEAIVHQAFSAGSRACVLKSEAAEHIIPALQALSEHRPYLASRSSQIVFESYLRGGLDREVVAPGALSPREREIVQLLAEGSANKEVATTLGISVKTVESHRAAIMRKLDLETFSDLVRYAVRNHIIEP